MQAQATQDTSNILLSGADPVLLRSRLPGGEFLLNHMLVQSSDENLPATVYLMHDWALANKGQFAAFAKYIDQPKEQIDDAIALFAKNRDEICTPAEPVPGEFPLLPLYLLYDCLMHVGAVVRKEREVGYLSGKFNEAKSIGIEDFLKYGTSGQVYNYVRIDGELKIASKNYYHSEMADGGPVQGAGEIELTRNVDDSVKKIRLNYFTGHYRVTPDTVDAVVSDVEQAVEQEPAPPQGRPRVFLSENSFGRRAP